MPFPVHPPSATVRLRPIRISSNPALAYILDQIDANWTDEDVADAERALVHSASCPTGTPNLRTNNARSDGLHMEPLQATAAPSCQRENLGESAPTLPQALEITSWECMAHDSSRENSTANKTAVPANLEHGEFELIEELGHGAEGTVYLARQAELSGRLVVLKFVPCSAREHIVLSRLQHSGIVPLYGIYDESDHNRRALCMPYFGRVTWNHILQSLEARDMGSRRGATIVEVIDALESNIEVEENAARTFLNSTDYERAVCWVGAQLADALHYAHERGLVHFDVKPSNVLISSECQPMLLDFHLARPPITAGDAAPHQLGGTPAFMAPELLAACQDVLAEQPIARSVDGRADIFSLGLLLYQGLSGELPSARAHVHPRLESLNANVGIGLADVVHKCLQPSPEDRYANAHDLAVDLRCYLEDRPFCGVANRSVAEVWGKWRRRRPLHMSIILLTVTLMAALAVLGEMAYEHNSRRRALAEDFYLQGQQLLQQGNYSGAIDALEHAFKQADGIASAEFTRGIAGHLRHARRAAKAAELKRLADQLREATLVESIDQRTELIFEVACKDAWKDAGYFANPAESILEPALERDIRRDLLDVAVLWADLHTRSRQAQQRPGRLKQAQQLLAEAERLLGDSVVLQSERNFFKGKTDLPSLRLPAKTAWEQYCLGRCLARAGNTRAACQELEDSLKNAPANYWSNYAFGAYSQRLGQHRQAVIAFSVCLGSRPSARCYLRRAQAFAGLEEWSLALRDLASGLKMSPNQTDLLLERGLVHMRRHDVALARADLTHVLRQDPGQITAAFQLANLHRQLGDFVQARTCLMHVLHLKPDHVAARQMLNELSKL